MSFKRILLVASDASGIQALRRALLPKDDWQLFSALGTDQALTQIQAFEPDVMICDLPDDAEDTAFLLAEVKRAWPRIARITLAPELPLRKVLRLLDLTHQLMRKPCEPVLLRRVVEQAFALQKMLDDPSLGGVGRGIDSLPTLPKAYLRVAEAMHDPQIGLRDLSVIVQRDTMLSARVLDRVNSAYFGLDTPITSVHHAVVYLGPEVTAGFALTMSIQRFLSKEFFGLERLDTSPAYLSKAPLFLHPDGLEQKDEALLAALLHDVGVMLFSLCVPEDRQEGIDNPAAGLCLKGIWACEEETAAAARSVAVEDAAV